MSRKLWLVARAELVYHLKQWTFYLSLLAMPLVFAAIGALPRLQDAAQEAPLPEVETVLTLGSEEISTQIGYIDRAGLIDFIPPEQADNFLSFAAEAEAETALEREEIESYYIIPADYLERGQIDQYSPNPQLIADTDAAFSALLRKNLLRRLEDEAVAARLEDPVNFVRDGPPAPIIRFIPADLDLNRLASAGLVAFLFVYLIDAGGNLLLRALQREVRASVLEVMIVSVTPAQLMGGKLLGLTALTLAQGGLTLLAGALVYGQNPGGSGPAALAPEALLISLPYLLLGFLAYCGWIMSIAAMWPDFRESGALLGLMRLLVLSPLIGGLFILPNPEGMLAVGLSLLPLTGHLLMPFRMLLGPVPAWQWGLGLVILAAWAALWIGLSFRLFRAHSLLTGRSATPRALWQALRG